MILVKTQQGLLGPDRIDFVPGHHSVIISSYEIDSLYVLLLYSKVLAELRLVLRVINRDSILTEPERDRVGTSFVIIRGCDTPQTPHLQPCPWHVQVES